MDETFLLAVISLIGTPVAYHMFGRFPTTAVIFNVDWHRLPGSKLYRVKLEINERQLKFPHSTWTMPGSDWLYIHHAEELIISKQGKPHFLISDHNNARKYSNLRAI